MSVFFAMVGEGADCLPAFFLTRAAAPADAVEISDARHAELLAAQSQGRRIVVDAGGRPIAERLRRPSASAIRARLRLGIQREAARRIRDVSPEWRQLNDLREPTEESAVRFARIDAIRAASNAIEQLALSLPAADLAGFPVANHTLWPEFD